jgi:hypothetical protein
MKPQRRSGFCTWFVHSGIAMVNGILCGSGRNPGPQQFRRTARSVPRKGNTMAASSRLIITEGERRSRLRVKLAVPVGGFGEPLKLDAGLVERELRRQRLGDDADRSARRQRDGLGKLILRGDGEGAPVDARDDGSSTVGKALLCRLDRPIVLIPAMSPGHSEVIVAPTSPMPYACHNAGTAMR